MVGLLNKKNVAFLLLFIGLVLFFDSISISPIKGLTSKSFTLFQFIGPLAVAFIGPFLGAVAILSSEIISAAFHGTTISAFAIGLLFPPLFAAFYFAYYNSDKAKIVAIVPLLSMVLFLLNPAISAAWLYTLYWLIPMVLLFLPKNLLFRTIGTTFTAHAVGSIAFLYLAGSPVANSAAFWLALIPVVAVERVVFASGMALTFVFLTTVLDIFSSRFHIPVMGIERKYAVFHTKKD